MPLALDRAWCHQHQSSASELIQARSLSDGSRRAMLFGLLSWADECRQPSFDVARTFAVERELKMFAQLNGSS